MDEAKSISSYVGMVTSQTREARFDDVGDGQQLLANVDLPVELLPVQSVEHVALVTAVQLAQRVPGARQQEMVRVQQIGVSRHERFKPAAATEKNNNNGTFIASLYT